MKTFILMLLSILLLMQCSLLADAWYTITVNDSGSAVAKGYTETTKPHTLLENEYPVGYAFPTNDLKFWKKVGPDWVAMSQAEQDAVTDAEKTVESDFDNWTPTQKAFVLVLLDEINLLRNQLGLAPRTVQQMKNAIKGNL